MNLRELLLQFAGQNEKALRADELIESSIRDVQYLSEENEAIHFLVINEEKYINEIVSQIDDLLITNEFDNYNITVNNKEIIVEF
jgi:5,10-methylenetetrahydrofolate reductase